jgi:hypothetical protein
VDGDGARRDRDEDGGPGAEHRDPAGSVVRRVAAGGLETAATVQEMRRAAASSTVPG